MRTKEEQQHYIAMRLPNGKHTFTIRASSLASGSLKTREKSRQEASASGSKDRMKETKDLTRRRVQTELKVETRNATAMRFFSSSPSHRKANRALYTQTENPRGEKETRDCMDENWCTWMQKGRLRMKERGTKPRCRQRGCKTVHMDVR